MSLMEETKLLLRHYSITPRKNLSQNFMVESSIFPLLAGYASLGIDDAVLDVGAGLGFLTRFLNALCRTVVAVELDSRLASILRDQLQNALGVEIVEGDVLTAPLPPFNKVVAVPPYHISSRFLTWLFKRTTDCTVLVLQKEFAGRLTASIGTQDYCWLAVLAYCYSDVEILDAVPKWVFYPQPEVDSVVTRLKPKKTRPFELNDEAMFYRLVRSLFTQRNRMVRNAILTYLRGTFAVSKGAATKIADTIPFRGKRVRELAPEDFGAIYNAISD